MPGLEIVDGTGQGFSAKVDDTNKLTVASVTEPELRRQNHHEGTVWSIDIPTITAGGAGNEFFYFKNDGDADLAISCFHLSSSAATRIRIFQVSGTASLTAGADAAITANNLGSSKLPTATIQTCTGASGLTDEGTLFYMELLTPNQIYHADLLQELIVPKGKAFAIERVAASGAITGYLTLVQHSDLSSDPY